jgi:ribose-phosphate pyrophosphokinase
MEDMGVKCIITLDIHSPSIMYGFQRMRVENLHASYQILRALAAYLPPDGSDCVVVAPDTGAVDRNKFYASALAKPMAMIYKERDYSKVSKNAADNNIREIRLMGDVKGKTVFLADDMIGTGGTMLKAMKFLREQGAGRVIAGCSLPLFSGDALKYFDEAYARGDFYRVIGTNGVYHGDDLLSREWYQSVNVSGLFAQVIARLHQGESVSGLLDNRAMIVRSPFLKDVQAGPKTDGSDGPSLFS